MLDLPRVADNPELVANGKAERIVKRRTPSKADGREVWLQSAAGIHILKILALSASAESQTTSLRMTSSKSEFIQRLFESAMRYTR